MTQDKDPLWRRVTRFLLKPITWLIEMLTNPIGN